MPFPESARVIYATNPLDEVICQLRFPPVLRIDAEIPAAFQESVRLEYPLLREQRTLIQTTGVPADFSQLLGSVTPLGGRKSYQFASTDETWRITLMRDFIALTCRNYRKWEEFKGHLEGPLEALAQHYQPAFYSRLGLRYRNIIVRSKLSLDGVSWKELLQPHVAGELGSEIAPSIEDIRQQLLLKQSEHNSKITIQHGTANVKDTGEECYYIDADFFTERRIEIGEADQILNYFNQQSGRLFRWCITARLHDAMGPAVVAPAVVG